jgi:hypothetical protein
LINKTYLVVVKFDARANRNDEYDYRNDDYAYNIRLQLRLFRKIDREIFVSFV